MLFKRPFVLMMWSAWMRMSEAWPSAPPRGWWIMISEFGRTKRLPLAPPAIRTAPMEAAMPKQTVDTSGLMYCMVS